MSDYAKIQLNHAVLRNLDRAAVRALEKTAEAVHTEVVQAQVIPRDTGNMQNDKISIAAGETVTARYEDGKTAATTITHAVGGHVDIIMSAPQVRRLYYHPEYHFQTKANPNAKGKWFEDWETGGSQGDFAPEAFRKLYKKEAGL